MSRRKMLGRLGFYANSVSNAMFGEPFGVQSWSTMAAMVAAAAQCEAHPAANGGSIQIIDFIHK